MLVNVFTKVGAREVKITQIDLNSLEVTLTKLPSNNEANDQLKEVIADFYDVPKSLVSIKIGHRSRHKVLLIDN